MGGHHDSRDDALMSEINMTPLVDVMLVLLIIFIVTVPVLTHTVKLELPRVTDRPAPAAAQTVTLSVTRQGDVYWDAQAVDPATLQARLAAIAARQPQPAIRIRADQHVEYRFVVALMAAAQKSGLSRLDFVTEPERVR